MADVVQITYEPKVDIFRDQLILRGYHPGTFNLAKEVGGRISPMGKGMVFPPYRSYGLWLQEAFSEAEWSEAAKAFMFQTEMPMDLIGDPQTKSVHTLYPYQNQAVNFLTTHLRGGLLALSPGLGKTAVSLVAADLLDAKNVLVISPLSLLRTWEKECDLWVARDLVRKYGLPPPSKEVMKEDGAWIVTNYDTVVRNKDYSFRVWDVLIIDESILVKNRKTKRFQGIKQIAQFSKRVWLLSGSPTSRFADDLWTQLHLIDPIGWPSYWRFAKRFCYMEDTVWGSQITGTRPDRDFTDELSDMIFVRNQKDVLPDLPEMRFETIEVELHTDQFRAHEELKEEFLARLDGEVEIISPEKMVQMIRLQQVTSNLTNLGPETWNDSSIKADTICEMVSDDAIELPLLIWTHWLPGAESLKLRLLKTNLRVGMINGQQKPALNEILFEKFKTGQLDILILAMQVGRFGHTLTSTRTIIYMDKTWDADAYFQSLHRVRRIGLTHSPRVITLKAPGTVDDIVELNLAGKLEAGAMVSNADLAMLLRSL